MNNSTRRKVLRLCGVSIAGGLAGCSGVFDGDGSDDIQDTDGDGVIDSEDYAPRDPEVQQKEDLINRNGSEQCECVDESNQTGSLLTDGFEDGTVSSWTPAVELSSVFEASQQRTFSGSWAARFSEGNTSNNPMWERVGNMVKPKKVETAHALENGEIYSDSFTEWRNDETAALRVNYNWSNNFLAVNGSGTDPSDIQEGAVVADLPWPSSDGFFHVVLAGIDWDNNIVGEVRVNGAVEAANVPLFNETGGIDRTSVFIAGDGGNIVFVDQTTVPTN